LTASVVDDNRTHKQVRVRLLDNKTGAPIDTRNRDGYIRLNNQTVDTNASGIAVANVKSNGYVSVSFEPTNWYTLGGDKPAYVDAHYRAGSIGPIWNPLVLLSEVLWPLISLALVIAVILWQLDGLVWIDTWPPWRLV